MKKNIQNKELILNMQWLPNLLTTASLFATFSAILFAIAGKFDDASITIFIAMIFDTLDGRVARLTNSASDFGAQYDSIADVVSFGVAPAILVYTFALSKMGRIGWLVSFIYLICTALRLARFNTKLEISDKKFFQGLPCPAAAAVLVSLIWLLYKCDLYGYIWVSWLLLLICIYVAALMVSNVGYYSFKDMNLKNKSPYMIGFVNSLLIIAVAIEPPLVLFVAFFIYSVSGITYTFIKTKKLKRARKKHSS